MNDTNITSVSEKSRAVLREQKRRVRKDKKFDNREYQLRLRKLRSAKRWIATTLICLLLGIFAIVFLMPTVLTFTNSFMGNTEISANYGSVFSSVGAGANSDRTYISEKVNLKFIPDKVTLSQYSTVLIKSPQYLIKFWNSVLLVLPIVVFQLLVAAAASYCFARYNGKIRQLIFFGYVIIMLMPYQVTLVPNYMVSEWLGLLDTNWAIILPGIFAPFSVFILTKFMKRIPSAMIEAAKLDGANEFQIFSKICLPLCKSTIYSVIILVFIDYWNMVEQPLILIKNSEMHPLSVFLSKINEADAGIAFAVASFYMIPTLLMFLYSEDYLVDGIAYSGGIKA